MFSMVMVVVFHFILDSTGFLFLLCQFQVSLYISLGWTYIGCLTLNDHEPWAANPSEIQEYDSSKLYYIPKRYT